MKLLTTAAVAITMAMGSADAQACDAPCKKRIVRPWNHKLDRIAYCESRNHWWINTGNGFYGGLQFTLRTWVSVGGRGFPHQATRLEQKYRAVRLIRVAGFRPWPVCGSA
jgi:hypothetical protein